MNNLRPANVALVVATAGVLLSTLIAALFASLTPLYLLVNAALLFGLLFGLTFLIMRRYIDAQLRSVRRIVHGDVSKSRDSIERAKAEAALWQTDQQNEMERLRNNDQYRKEFVANVTHELKTPLFNIQGYVHSLLDGALEDDGVNRLFLNKAARNVDRLATLVADLETITQLETGGAVFQPEVFDLAALVHDVFEQLEIKAAEKQKTLVFDEGSNEPVYVYADKEKIRIVLVNLLENSIKYGNVNGRTNVQLIDGGENILVEVSDDGPGIPNEHLNRLFERFYRVDKSRSRDAGGTGLGLAIVKHILEGHGRTVSVTSVLGKHTTFRFALEKR